MTTRTETATIIRMNLKLTELLRALRREGRASQMMTTGLDAMLEALGAEGAAVIRGAPDTAVTEPKVLYRAGAIGLPATSAAMLLWRAAIGTPAVSVEPNGRPIAVGVCRESSTEKLGVVFWRRRGACPWSGEDVPLLDAIAGIVWLLVDREPNHRDVPQYAATDALTALLNQRTFVTEAARHIARLDGDNLPGTLMLAEVDNLNSVAPTLGADAADDALRRAASLLRNAVRPTDLVARTGDTEFAVWMSGADHMTAAERAEALCLEAPSRMTPQGESGVGISFSIGIATRRPGESFPDLVRRAGQAIRQVKDDGGGYWRVSLGQPA